MTALFQYICPGCGGHLVLNEERQIFVCGSCGNVFDYDYFREDKLLDMADKARSKSEFKSASEMYQFMLNKEPHNFRALDGLMLCENKLTAISNITRLVKEKTFSTTVVNFDKFKEACPEDKREYFELAEEGCTLARKAMALNNNLDAMGSNRRRLYSKIENNEHAGSRYYVRSKGGNETNPVTFLRATLVLVAIYMAFVWGLSFVSSTGIRQSFIMACGFSIFGLVVFAIPICIGITLSKKYKKAHATDAEINAQINEVDQEMRAMSAKQDEIENQLKQIVYKINRIK